MRIIKKTALRALMVAILPFAITWSVLARLQREFRAAVCLAWQDACAEVEALKKQWSDV